MKRSWLSQLFISLSIGLLAIGVAEAATLVPIIACIDCHGTNPQTNQPPIEGSERNNPPRAIIGSHSYHITTQTMTCSNCHVVPTTLNHRDGKIQMASPMAGGVTYSAAVGGVVTQSNQLTTAGMGTCSSTAGCHVGGSPVFGTSSNCRTCHGYPPVTTTSDVDNKHVSGATPVNHIGTLATANTKDKFVSVHGGCQICHGTESTTDATGNTHAPHANYIVSTQHATGNINMNGPVGTGTGYDSTTRGCAAACHASTAPYRMTASGKTLTYGNYGTGGDCISCHTTIQASPVAAAIVATVTQRPAIVPQFASVWSHKRSGGGTVTKEDCCVCHMEGDVATGSPNATYHKNGYIELRDPDLGTTIKAVTHSGTATTAGTFTSNATDAKFVRFSRNLGITLEAETAAIPGVAGLTNFQVIGAIEVNLCLKCHDANGATSALARVPTTGTAMRPFGVAITGLTAGQNTNGDGNVVNVALTLATSNASYHPVIGKQNNSYSQGAQMIAPWNGVTKTNGNNTQYGALISCWDCHSTLGQTGIMTSNGTTAATVTAHGAAVTLRGPIRAAGTTASTNLCVNCHATKYATTSSQHGSGSAFTAGASNMGTATFNNCSYCHGYGVVGATYSAGSVTRPRRAEEAHGFNDRVTGTIGSKWSNGNRPYAFIRNTLSGWAPKSATGDTITNPSTCSGTGGTCNNNMNNSSNGLGGVY